MQKKDFQNFKLKLKLPAILRSPFSRRGGKKKAPVDDGDSIHASSSYEVNLSTADVPTGGLAPSPHHDTDATSTTRGSRSSLAPSLHAFTVTVGGQEFGSTDGRCQSPAPSQARSHRQSMSKNTSGENVRVSITVDTIKQQLNDGLQILAEFKKSLRPSSDVQRYDEAVGTLEGAAKGLATLKSKLSSNRKVAGNPNRNSYVLPPPDLKVEFEDTPFSMGIPGIEESLEELMKESKLDVVQEAKETEVQEEGKGKVQEQQHCVWI